MILECYQHNLIWFFVDKLDKITNLFLANMSNFELFLEISYFIKGGIICKEIMWGVTFSALFKNKSMWAPFFPSKAFIKDRFFLKSVVICRSRHFFLLLLQLTYCFYVMYLKVHVDIKLSKKFEVFLSICF